MTQNMRDLLIKIQKERPFIFNVSEYFPIDLVASGLRSIGAFPLMSNAEQEIDEIFNLAQAVVINLGKLNDDFVKICSDVCSLANKHNKPIILDPVGAGISRYRTDIAINLIKENSISMVRAYPNEIASLLDGQLTITNHSVIEYNELLDKAKKFSEEHNLLVVLSGKLNTIIDGNKFDQFNYDSFLLQKVAGIGNLLSSMLGAFHAVETDRFLAAQKATEFYGKCVSSANSRAKGPGSLKMELIDQLYKCASESIQWYPGAK
ncbi:Hydroxyethylthiazole kinase [Legionella massiliensis]|uniref:hydroxyethylthiazole kinase n=1 Tax=Legionella massiliensis TaxID=1034943 RepID=A0A078L1A1_9GAMM|nr:hydroxyethylthiazole kinase [Legionella massiliensis]CDZ79007.1 Hydroxyethylthiazole kinase [Legionella massiliensis]CEE14745.1 Hydroxyethylthiazole kinase [Legionella massiliensis]